MRVKITSFTDGGFRGTTCSEDDQKIYLAGGPECPPDFIGSFFDYRTVTKEDFEREDWRKCITRIEKKAKKK